ncbi:MAG: dephospho-CoA kinase [Nitrospirota bacterium]
MLVIGLTGNYGMGKSTVLKIFRDLGATVIDADSLVRAALNDEKILKRIRGVLGDDVFLSDNSFDKAKAALIIFRNKGLREKVEEILHPIVLKGIDAILDKTSKETVGVGIVVVEIPLLFEKGYDKKFSKTITVYTDIETAIGRLKSAGIRQEDAVMRMNAQMPVEEKTSKSDFVIDNNSDLSRTELQVREIYSRLVQEAKGRHD